MHILEVDGTARIKFLQECRRIDVIQYPSFSFLWRKTMTLEQLQKKRDSCVEIINKAMKKSIWGLKTKY